jgi:HK97 family phage prohead protease/HK97 family phage major capsid protein
MQQLIIEASSIECSEERREISGKIVPMGTGEIGHTNMGGVVFEAGSIEIDDPSKIKLLSQHDMKKPIGRMVTATVRQDGIYATFKLSRSTAGNDALIQAQEGLVSGLSVGAEVIASKPSRDGHTVVSSARLREVSLVTEPAFKSAQVLEIAAEEVIPAEETQPESEPVVEETTTPVEAPAVEAAAVEAARPTVVANLQVKERIAPITSAQYLEASIKSALGDDEARRIVRAADDSTSTNTGLSLPSHLNTFLTDTFSGRPVFDAVTKQALTETGMSFTVPRLYTNAGTPNVAPTVATTAEAAAPSETGMTSSYDTVSISKMSGLNRVSFELIDRSSPAFMELLMTELRKAYEKATDTAVLTELIASGTAATSVAATAAGLQSFISTEGAAAYKGTGGDFANKLVANTDQWAAITSYADSTGRALYSAQGATMNASGSAVASSVRGNILGTDLIVDHNIAASGVVDNSAFLIAPSSVYVWESPTTQLRLNVLQSGEVEINLYGYLAIYVAKSGKGVRKFNLT